MNARKTLLISLMAGAMLAPAITHAQSNDIINRLNRMQNEIDTLNRALYKGEPVPVPSAPPIDPAQNSAVLDRMQQMENDLRTLTGRVEQQTYDIDQMKKQVEAFSYQMEQMHAQNREPTPIVPQSADMLRPDEAQVNVPPPVNETATETPPSQPPPQPNQMGMQTATPALPDGSDPTALYEAAYTKIKSSDFAGAETAFAQFIKLYPDHKLAGNAYYWLGESYYARGDYKKATKTFAQSYQKFPKGAKGPDNLLKLGLSLAAEGKKQDGCTALMQLSKEYPTAAPEIMSQAESERQKLGC